MKFKTILGAALLAPLLAGAVHAADPGDAAKGESDFKRCKACHAIIADDGTPIVKGGATGPNLYGVIGRAVASVEGFKYGDGILAAGATGAVWDEAALAEYIVDPGAWVQKTSGDPAAKTNMTFKLKKGAEDMAAYLATQKAP